MITIYIYPVAIKIIEAGGGRACAKLKVYLETQPLYEVCIE